MPQIKEVDNLPYLMEEEFNMINRGKRNSRIQPNENDTIKSHLNLYKLWPIPRMLSD